jgi:hypothetical protein
MSNIAIHLLVPDNTKQDINNLVATAHKHVTEMIGSQIGNPLEPPQRMCAICREETKVSSTLKVDITFNSIGIIDTMVTTVLCSKCQLDGYITIKELDARTHPGTYLR